MVVILYDEGVINTCIIGKISLKLVKYILLSILPHSYMLYDQLQCTVRSFGACISQFAARPQTCLTWYVHIIKGNIFYTCTSLQRPLTIRCPHNTMMCFLVHLLIFSLTKIWSPWCSTASAVTDRATDTGAQPNTASASWSEADAQWVSKGDLDWWRIPRWVFSDFTYHSNFQVVTPCKPLFISLCSYHFSTSNLMSSYNLFIPI